MYDRRVVRGNTYAAQILPAIPMAPAPAVKPKPRRRKAAARKPATPPPVDGRAHMDIQTDSFLEEVTDMQPEEEAGTQTDAFLERPVTPLFVPQKRGVDAETQIEDGELFDFAFEVEPLLEVLVGKTLEQGLMEVCSRLRLFAIEGLEPGFLHLSHIVLSVAFIAMSMSLMVVGGGVDVLTRSSAFVHVSWSTFVCSRQVLLPAC